MKLDSATSIYNMGDTSIRVKQVVDVNKVILQQLSSFMNNCKYWERNTVAQEEFYRSFIKEIVRIEKEDGIDLFRDFARARNYTIPAQNKIGLRARTLTNALVKSGLISSNRDLSEVGKHYLNNKLKSSDDIEKILGLYSDNLVYLRQFLKLRVYAHDSDDYFYNFRVALKFLSYYDDIPQSDFLRIIESIKPQQSKSEIIEIIEKYKNVSEGKQTFEEYYKYTFSPLLRSQQELDNVREMFHSRDFTDDNFIKYFPNRDKREVSLLYKRFVINLIDLIENHSENAFKEIKRLSRNTKIKKAFSANKIPFSFSNNETIDQFLEKNNKNPLLDTDIYQIYLEFIFSKHNDLIKEYSDMCKRYFQITGLISFDKGLVNLNNKWIIKPLIKILGENFSLNGTASYKDYEKNMESVWFKDKSICEILGISNEMTNELFEIIGIQFGVEDLSNIPTLINNKREQEYRDFVDSHFPKEKIIDILEDISIRNDDKVFKQVTEYATIPTIYEYILTIAWYHISDKKDYLLHESFQLTLDGSKLPLTHRGGGAGDIEIITDKYALLIEATLMDMNTQKRGELEPVIRHATNFTLHNKGMKQVQSLFIANELDDNVLNIFRATQFIQLNGTIEVGSIDGLNIFALTTKEIILLLEKDIKDTYILEIINNNSDNRPIIIENGWRHSIVNKIFS